MALDLLDRREATLPSLPRLGTSGTKDEINVLAATLRASSLCLDVDTVLLAFSTVKYSGFVAERWGLYIERDSDGAWDGATLRAPLECLDVADTTLRAFSIVKSSGLVTHRGAVYLERAWDGAIEYAGAYSIALGSPTCDGALEPGGVK